MANFMFLLCAMLWPIAFWLKIDATVLEVFMFGCLYFSPDFAITYKTIPLSGEAIRRQIRYNSGRCILW